MANTDSLYPLTFVPRFVEKMWGGRRLEALDKPLPPEVPIGESWELYDFPPGVVEKNKWTSAPVAAGPLQGKTIHDLMQQMPDRLLGKAKPVETPAGPQFPILIKFLDADQDLSVQVHPTNEYAASHPDAHLKNEAWYVLAHEPTARLLKGLRPGVTREQFEQAIHDGTVERHLVSLPAKVGETHYLASGTVHALGGGMLVAEVQTPSDTTYRVYDFKRIDPSTGQERQLHIEQALDNIDFANAGRNDDPTPPGDGVVASAPQFTISRWTATAGVATKLAAGSMSVLMLLEGDASIMGESFESVRIHRGQTVLMPADLVGPQLMPTDDCVWLEVTFPQPH